MSGFVVGALRPAAGAAGVGGGAAGCICCSSCFIKTESTAVESFCAKRPIGINREMEKMYAFFFTTPSKQWLRITGFFPDIGYAIVWRTGGARRENEVKRTKECEEVKIKGCAMLACAELSIVKGEETKKALPEKNEQVEHVSA